MGQSNNLTNLDGNTNVMDGGLSTNTMGSMGSMGSMDGGMGYGGMGYGGMGGMGYGGMGGM
eukprot:CAMPEP_0116890818 /NCGR_PEP_ID=MMETSP0467-20121206/1328_1 /TAXON_ID=283647 /ORGANISM="Mesodinium pulex, Strain SPMC105" /LENGTH=60 /DNA_ID=CAMNT_0004558901 /DNA_START=123 /DNA_END=305 /DNA_ORIENTATION=+